MNSNPFYYFIPLIMNEHEEDILPYLHPHASVEEFQRACQERLERHPEEARKRIRTWLRIGRKNLWIQHAYDPPFTELSFQICADIRELSERLLHGNWCLGQAFALDDICFINQVDGGDEWLTIKGGTGFESITMQTHEESREKAERRLLETIEEIRTSTEIQCARLEYGRPYELLLPSTYDITRDDVPGETALILTCRHEDRRGEEREYRHLLSARTSRVLHVFRNSTAHFVLAVDVAGAVTLHYFWDGKEPRQEAIISRDVIAQMLGEDFSDLAPLEQLQRLLPHLQPIER